MPLLFAFAGIVALGLSFVVLVGPVLIVVGAIRALRSARRAPSEAHGSSTIAIGPSPVDALLADEAFAALISREWPTESTVLRHPAS
jgi:hypothetical protein